MRTSNLRGLPHVRDIAADILRQIGEARSRRLMPTRVFLGLRQVAAFYASQRELGVADPAYPRQLHGLAVLFCIGCEDCCAVDVMDPSRRHSVQGACDESDVS